MRLPGVTVLLVTASVAQPAVLNPAAAMARGWRYQAALDLEAVALLGEALVLVYLFAQDALRGLFAPQHLDPVEAAELEGAVPRVPSFQLGFQIRLLPGFGVAEPTVPGVLGLERSRRPGQRARGQAAGSPRLRVVVKVLLLHALALRAAALLLQKHHVFGLAIR